MKILFAIVFILYINYYYLMIVIMFGKNMIQHDGIKLEFIEYFVKNSLKESSSILYEGDKITPQPEHIQFGVNFNKLLIN